METKIKKEIARFGSLFTLIFIASFVGTTVSSSLKKLERESSDFKFVSISRRERSKLCQETSKENSIEIPKINIEAPLIFPEEEDSDLVDDLDKGVTHYPETVLPGEEGLSIFLGHSAPPGYPKIKYDWVFSDLNNLEKDDEVFINFKECRYTYRATDKIFLEKGEEIPNQLTETSNSVIILISCWPPGRNVRRIGVVLELNTS